MATQGLYTWPNINNRKPKQTRNAAVRRRRRFYKTTDEHMSPVIEAALQNDVTALKRLLESGVYIARPHRVPCWCIICRTASPNETLDRTRYRLLVYQALASPSYICLTSADPVLEAFKLVEELKHLKILERESDVQYQQLIEQCEEFTYDLIDSCRSSDDVLALLSLNENTDVDAQIKKSEDFVALDRLQLAIELGHKRFVAHPHCQQLLTSIWYEGFPGRQERGSLMNVVICVLLMFAWPLMSLCYIFAPKSRIGQVVRSPFMKFLYYSTSFGCFLLLLTVVSVENIKRTSSTHLPKDDRGPMPTTTEWLIFWFVIGMVWAECKQIWDEGFSLYVHQWWNYLDFAMMCLYLCTISVRTVAIYFHYSGLYTPRTIARSYWKATEPKLIAEGLFAIANVFSFARIVYLFQTNPYLGPLQISLGCMLLDIGKFFFIFFLILTSFAFGLHQLYWHYFGKSFSTIEESYLTLLWSLFSITNRSDADIPTEYVHDFTQWIGRGLYILYHVTSIIVLLNMLIAMMSFSFQRINENSDLEWKFHRSKLWMSYFDEGSSLAAPFNIIPTPKTAFYLLCGAFRAATRCIHGAELFPIGSKRRGGTIRRPGYNRKKWNEKKRPVSLQEDIPTYREIMERLVHRYIHMMKKEMKMDGVNEDDLLEIKQDISSLRFELREDRRREILRWSNQLDGTKREIIRSLSIAPGDKARFLSKRNTRAESVSPVRLPSSPEHYSRQPQDSGRQSQQDSFRHSVISSGPSSPTSFFAPPSLIPENRSGRTGSPTDPYRSIDDTRSLGPRLSPERKPDKPEGSKKLSSVSFKTPADDSPRVTRNHWKSRSERPKPGSDHGILITVSPESSRPGTSSTQSNSISVQTDAPGPPQPSYMTSSGSSQTSSMTSGQLTQSTLMTDSGYSLKDLKAELVTLIDSHLASRDNRTYRPTETRSTDSRPIDTRSTDNRPSTSTGRHQPMRSSMRGRKMDEDTLMTMVTEEKESII